MNEWENSRIGELRHEGMEEWENLGMMGLRNMEIKIFGNRRSEE